MIASKTCRSSSPLLKSWAIIFCVFSFFCSPAQSGEATATESNSTLATSSTYSTRCPDVGELSKYEVKPWLFEIETSGVASTPSTTIFTEFPELKDDLREPAAKTEMTVNAPVRVDGKSGNLESDIINSFADFVTDRSQAEFALWFIDNVMGDVCGKEATSMLFPNVCEVNKDNSNAAYPSLSSLLTAFKRDMETMPAVMLCQYQEDLRGYYIRSIFRGMARGIDPVRLLAGLADNEELKNACQAEYKKNQVDKYCGLYVGGALMQAYGAGYQQSQPRMNWELFFKQLNLNLDAISVHDSQQAGGHSKIEEDLSKKKTIISSVVEIHYLVRDVAFTLNNVMNSRNDKNSKVKDVLPYALQLSGDMTKLLNTPVDLYFPGKTGSATPRKGEKSRDILERTFSIYAAGAAGRYSDVMLDLSKIVNQHIIDKCEMELNNYLQANELSEKAKCEPYCEFKNSIDMLMKKINADNKKVFTDYFENDKKTPADKSLGEVYQELSAWNSAYLLKLNTYIDVRNDKRDEVSKTKREKAKELRTLIEGVNNMMADYLDEQRWYHVSRTSLDYWREIKNVHTIADDLQSILGMTPAPTSTLVKLIAELNSAPTETLVELLSEKKTVPADTSVKLINEMKSAPTETLGKLLDEIRSVPTETLVNTLREMRSAPAETLATAIIEMRSAPTGTVLQDLMVFVESYHLSQIKDQLATKYNKLAESNSESGSEVVAKGYKFEKFKVKYESLNDVYALSEALPVIAALSTAQTKEDITKVLEDMSSPLGGWKIKQQKAWTFSITSLVGYQIARDHTRKAPSPDAYSTGLLAPVGLDISTNYHKGQWYWPDGVVASVIDFGNLVNTRINNPKGVETTDMSFRQIVALGLYLKWALGKSPGVAGFGYSFSPALRTVRDDNGNKEEIGTHRFMFFVTIDTTLYFFGK